MKNENVKKRLSDAIARSVPDVLDNILAQCETVEGEVSMTEGKKTVEKTKKFKSVYKIAAAMAAMLVLVVGAVGITQSGGNEAVDMVVAFDVNPSIELEVNAREQVMKAIPLNEDAEIVLDGLKLKGVDIETAVNAIVGSMLQHGYLSVEQNSILVSVKCNDETKAAEVQANISTDISTILEGTDVELSVVTQVFDIDEELEQIASENCISHAKAKLISRIIAAGLTDAEGYEYTYERLAELTVTELMVLLDSKDVSLDDVVSSGSASGVSYLGKDNALAAAYADAGVAAEDVLDAEVDMDYEDGKMIYEIEFFTEGKEYEYILDAITGEIISSNVVEFEEPPVVPQLPEGEVPEEGVLPEDGVMPQIPEDNKKPENCNPNEPKIGRGNAKKIAMNHMGVDRHHLGCLECDFGVMDGKYVYKVTVEQDGVEYLYIIDVYTGEILDIITLTTEEPMDKPEGNWPNMNNKPNEGKPEDNQQGGNKPGGNLPSLDDTTGEDVEVPTEDEEDATESTESVEPEWPTWPEGEEGEKKPSGPNGEEDDDPWNGCEDGNKHGQGNHHNGRN